MDPVKIRNSGSLAANRMIQLLWRYKRILGVTTLDELSKRYAGSYMGKIWVFLNPLLFLGIYLFVYLVVFRVRFPGYSELDYVVYVFAGLVPYLAFMEAMTLGAVCIRQNIHLIRNVILPLDLVPARTTAVSLISQIVGLAMVILLSIYNGSATWSMALLPLALVLQVLFLMGLVLMVSAIGIIIPDLSFLINLGVLLLMFVSPIAFRPEMVPEGLSFVIYLNPITYMVEIFRACLIEGYVMDTGVIAVATLGSVFVFVVGCAIFYRFKSEMIDYV